VILINLLPHREAARKRRRESFLCHPGRRRAARRSDRRARVRVVQAQISSQQAKNNYWQTEIKKLESEIKEISTLQEEIAACGAPAGRGRPAGRPQHARAPAQRTGAATARWRLSDQHEAGRPDRDVQGMAQSNERVSELLRNLGNNSPWLVKPELVEITSPARRLEPARPAPRCQLHDAHRPQAPNRCTEAGRRRASAPAKGARCCGGSASSKVKRTVHGDQKFRSQSRRGRRLAALLQSVPRAQSERSGGRGRRAALCALPGRHSAIVLVALWFVWLTNSNDELEAERAKEVTLKRRLPEEGGAGREPRSAEEAARAGAAVRDAARKAIAQQGGNGCPAVRHQPGRPRPQPAVRAVPPGPGEPSRTTTPSCRSRSASPAATTTWALSWPTSPTCRASSP
jgi:type IV pilus assembly protein PilN